MVVGTAEQRTIELSKRRPFDGLVAGVSRSRGVRARVWPAPGRARTSGLDVLGAMSSGWPVPFAHQQMTCPLSVFW